MVLERNDDYFGAKPDWAHVTYKPITNDAARVAALLSGDVDLIGNVPGNDVAGLRKNPNVVVATLASNRCYFWTLDVDRDNSPQIADGTSHCPVAFRSGIEISCNIAPPCFVVSSWSDRNSGTWAASFPISTALLVRHCRWSRPTRGQ